MLGKKPVARDEILALLPGYALGALTPEEPRTVEEYLRRHPELMPRLHNLENAAAALAEGAPEHSLPTGLKQSVMQRVRADVKTERPLLGARPRRAAEPAPETRAQPAPRVRREAAPEPFFRRFQRWWEERRYAGPALGLAGALAVFLLVVALQTQTTLQRSNATLAALQTRVETVERDNQLLQAAVTVQRRQIAGLLEANQSVALAGTDAAPATRALFFADGAELVVLASGLNPLPADQTYQLWLIPEDGAPVSAGLFAGDPEGIVTFLGAALLPVTAYGAVGISIEPVGGSPAPTGPIVALGEVG